MLTEQDGILCGGAVTSCLTLAVRLVEHCLGTARAVKTAGLLLIDTQRIAQSAYATLVAENEHADRLVARAQQRMQNTLPQRFSLPDLAAHLAVSERTLNRHFKQATGFVSPWLSADAAREVAKRLLESGHLSLAAIGQRIGYHDPAPSDNFSNVKPDYHRAPISSVLPFRHRHLAKRSAADLTPGCSPRLARKRTYKLFLLYILIFIPFSY